MITLTERGEAMLEQALTMDEALEFLKDESNFQNVAGGIREWFAKCYPEVSKNKITATFVNKMKELYGERPTEKTVRDWLRGNRMPSRNSAIKICFALGLSKDDANAFMWEVCRLSPLNFRCADELVYAYALDNNLPYRWANNTPSKAGNEESGVVQRYELATEHINGEDTAGSVQMERIFSKLKGLPEDFFYDILCDNKNNFINYRKTAHEKFKSLYKTLLKTFNSVECKEGDEECADNTAKIINGILGDRLVNEVLTAHSKIDMTDKPVLEDILRNFPRYEYILNMLKDPTVATETDYSYARKTYVLLFFANEVLKHEKELSSQTYNANPKMLLFENFRDKLNADLDSCGYGQLYVSNPYDWLIMNCIRILSSAECEGDDLSAFDRFSEILYKLITDNGGKRNA